jgi:hypothetical protein
MKRVSMRSSCSRLYGSRASACRTLAPTEFVELVLRRLGFKPEQAQEIIEAIAADRAPALAPQLVEHCD